MEIDRVVAEQFQKALTADASELMTLVAGSSGEILVAAIKNRNLSEPHIMSLLKRRDIDENVIRILCHLPITESSHKVKVAISRHPKTSAHLLGSIIPNLYLFELLDITLLPELPPDHKMAAELALIKRLPTTPLGNKITLARRGNSALLEAIIKEGDPRLMDVCISNPKAKEGSIFQYLRSTAATAETISIIARHPRWQGRPNIREAILSNPKTPMIWFTLWLPGMNSAELKKILASNRLTSAMKKAVAEYLAKYHG